MATREQVIKLMSDYIKETAKNVLVNGGKSNCVVPIEHMNWYSGFNRGKWVRSEIAFNCKKYEFEDKEITDREFCKMVEQALEMSKVSGKVFAETSYSGNYQFQRLEIYQKPCKEFIALNKFFEKLGCKPLELLEVFHVGTCGKRSSWGERGARTYLAFDPQGCTNLKEFIKKNKIRGGKVRVKLSDFESHGDETDYNIAIYQESEWYGSIGKKIELLFINSKGEPKKVKEFNYQYRLPYI